MVTRIGDRVNRLTERRLDLRRASIDITAAISARLRREFDYRHERPDVLGEPIAINAKVVVSDVGANPASPRHGGSRLHDRLHPLGWSLLDLCQAIPTGVQPRRSAGTSGFAGALGLASSPIFPGIDAQCATYPPSNSTQMGEKRRRRRRLGLAPAWRRRLMDESVANLVDRTHWTARGTRGLTHDA